MNIKKYVLALVLLTVYQTFPTDVVLNSKIDFDAKISISYIGLICSNDNNLDLRAKRSIRVSAGACLIDRITASVYLPGKSVPVTATAYTSSGTGYRTFNLIQRGNGFAVIRPE